MKDLLELSRELKGMAEAGLRYSEGAFDRERYERIHEIASELLQAGRPDFRWPMEMGYQTPKLDTRAAVISDGKILLAKERSNHLWTLPGGWADTGETAAGNAIREVREETGYEVEAVKLLAVWDKACHGHPREPEYAYKLVFACRLLGGEMTTCHEIEEVGWFAPDALPEMCPHRASPEYVALAFRHFEEASLATEFD